MKAIRIVLLSLLLLTVFLGCAPIAEVGDNLDIGSVKAVAITKTLPSGLWKVVDSSTNITCLVYVHRANTAAAISCIGPEEG